LPMVQLHFGSPQQFSTVTDFLGQADYTEPAVSKRLGLGGLHEYLRRAEKPWPSPPAEKQDTLDLLSRVFLAGYSVSRELMHRFIPVAVQESWEALGILCTDPAHPGECYSPVALYPVEGLWIASDRWRNPNGSPIPNVKDFVFPAIHPLTHIFLDSLPQSPCDGLLDLGSGTGIAALLGSKHYARHSWAVDITERATQFAEFNRCLNGLSNTTVLQGNLYEPVGGMTFDRIVAHPPYVPSLESGAIYADGGEDGESITRAIVEGLPRYLASQGCLFCDTMGVEREGQPFEQRVRQWLGAEQSAFDILFIADSSQGPAQFAYRATRHKKGTWELMDQWRAHLEKLKVKRLVNGWLVIQRKESARSAFTTRRQKGEHTKAAEVEWLRSWETLWGSPNAIERGMQSRLLASPNLELHVVHSKRNGELAPTKFTLMSRHPFAVEYECPAWVATLVERCDGKITALEHFAAGKREQWIPLDIAADRFASTLGQLISRGLLEIEGFEPPRQTNARSEVPARPDAA